MRFRWLAVTAIVAVTACNESAGPNIGADGFWRGAVPEGSLEMRLFEDNLSLDGFGAIKSDTTQEISASGSRRGATVTLAITQGPTHAAFAAFSGEVSTDSLIGTWTSVGGTAATVRLAKD